MWQLWPTHRCRREILPQLRCGFGRADGIREKRLPFLRSRESWFGKVLQGMWSLRAVAGVGKTERKI